MPTRREVLRSSLGGSALLALSPTVPEFLARTARAAGPERDGRVLVIVQLDGGNDAINTLVPYADEGYARYRKALRLDKNRLIRIDDQVGLHPAMREVGALLERGQVALVPGVGYPNPNRSHSQSMAIWQSARLEPERDTGPGWIGRAFDGLHDLGTGARPGTSSLFVGDGVPPAALRGRRAAASALAGLDDLKLTEGLVSSLTDTRLASMPESGEDLLAFVRRSQLDAYASADRVKELAAKGGKRSAASYPDDPLGERLRIVSHLLRAGLGARVFYTVQPGYDTHAGQQETHHRLLRVLSEALGAFFEDLSTAGLAERVLVLCFSEFGRRVAENSSAGTDHGTAGLVLLAGQGVRGGVHGKVPSLTDLPDGDPRWSLDFRRIYATVLESWLGIPSEPALGGRFERVALLRNTS
jgi:uncharacterized protein (DUF1501 family)